MVWGTAEVLANPGDIGGTPNHTEVDSFQGAGFSADVHSFVFYGTNADLPDDPVFPALVENETLIVYLIHNTGSTGDVDLLGLLNPAGINPHSIGVSSVIPEDFEPEYQIDPSIYEGSVQLIQYQWIPAGFGYIEPEDWSLVFYRIMGFWQPVDAFVGLGDDLDSQQIPGPAPIPEPAALAVLVFGLGMLLRRPKRK
jgi:hypothetical protein